MTPGTGGALPVQVGSRRGYDLAGNRLRRAASWQVCCVLIETMPPSFADTRLYVLLDRGTVTDLVQERLREEKNRWPLIWSHPKWWLMIFKA